jgi:hypothetical protein
MIKEANNSVFFFGKARNFLTCKHCNATECTSGLWMLMPSLIIHQKQMQSTPTPPENKQQRARTERGSSYLASFYLAVLLLDLLSFYFLQMKA